MKTVNFFLKKWKNSNKPYLHYGGSTLTYAEVFFLAKSGESLLRSLGIQEQNIAIFASNSPEYVISYFAVLFTASTNIPINTALTDREIESELNYCDCNWIICQEKFSDRMLAIAETCKTGIIKISPNGRFMKIMLPQELRKRQNSSEIAVMLHTSGTTGAPKKVMLSHANLIANTHSNILSLTLSASDVVLIALPLFFGYCHTAQFLTHTRLGGQIVIFDAPLFTSKYFCQLVTRYKVSCFTAVPTMLSIIDKYPYLHHYDMSSLKYICFGGGAVALHLLERLINKFPHAGIVQTYGQTECAPRVTALMPVDSIKKIGSIGKAIPHVEVNIVDEAGNTVDHQEIGEIIVKGANVSPGYYKRPEIFEEIYKNGWLHTGDLGYFDQDGYIYLVGRRKNMIISGGINIYPEEIENIIIAHEAIKEVMVKGEKDDMLGEVAVAHVVFCPKKHITINELCQFLNDKLAVYKHPKKLVSHKKFNRTPTGKLKRTLLINT